MSCWLCDNPAPRPPRQGEGHHAVRFGDRDLLVELDGEDVSNLAFESMVGPDGTGWVALYPGPPKRRCEVDRDHAHAELRTGRVQVTTSRPAGSLLGPRW